MILQDKKVDVFSNRFGGNGDVIMEHYIDEALLNDAITMYAKVILKPGCSLGYHQHNGNSETIVVLQGTAQYNDNGTAMELQPGTVMHCPNGESHSIGNAADAKEDLILQAIVVKVNA